MINEYFMRTFDAGVIFMVLITYYKTCIGFTAVIPKLLSLRILTLFVKMLKGPNNNLCITIL